MALKLLAGPYSMRDLDGNYCEFFKQPMWFDQLQAMIGPVIKRTPAGGLLTITPGHLTQINGAVLRRNEAVSNNSKYSHDLDTGGISEANTYASGYFKRLVHHVSLVAAGAAEPSPTALLGGVIQSGGKLFHIDGSGDIYSRPVGGSTDTLELELTSALNGDAWSPGPAAGQVFVAGRSNALLYDVAGNALVGWERKLGATAAWPMIYSKELGVWLVLTTSNTPTTHNQISIYADQAVPTTLSAPAALSAVNEGAAPQFRVRLTGASGEPCEGYLVDWAIQLPAKLLALQSTTDSDGYATVSVAVPLNTSGQNFDLTAEVVF